MPTINISNVYISIKIQQYYSYVFTQRYEKPNSKEVLYFYVHSSIISNNQYKEPSFYQQIIA